MTEQRFTDEDLKRLKESLDTYEDEQQQCYRVKEFKALLARLEVADKVCVELDKRHPTDRTVDENCELEAWRKVSGRD